MKLSILMPVYKGQHTIRAALLSCLRSMPRDSEILVLLEGENLDSYDNLIPQDSRIQVLKRCEPGGISQALNELLQVSSGEFVARMDADDISLPWRFRYQLSAIQRTNSDFLFSNAIIFGKKVKPFRFIPQPPVALSPSTARLILGTVNPFVHPSLLAKREAMIDLGGYSSAPAEDYELWLRAAVEGKTLSRSWLWVILYRVHPSQLSQQNKTKLAIAADPVMAAAKARLRELVGIERGFDLDAELDSNIWKAAAKENVGIFLERFVFRKLIASLREVSLGSKE